MKSGTTSLHSYLGKHPDIFVSQNKELKFFTKETYEEKGIKWYKNQFISNKKIVGESSPQYSQSHLYPNVAKLIYKHCPNVKLIYIIRNPIDRIISNYLENVTGEQLNKSFENIMSAYELKEHPYVLTSKYFLQLSEYLKYFDRSQIHVTTLDSLQNNRLETLNKVFSFLDLSKIKDESLFNYSENQNANKTIDNIIIRIFRRITPEALKQLLSTKLKLKLKNSQAFIWLTKTKTVRPLISQKLKTEIQLILKEDVNQLEQYLNKSLEHWK